MFTAYYKCPECETEWDSDNNFISPISFDCDDDNNADICPNAACEGGIDDRLVFPEHIEGEEDEED